MFTNPFSLLILLFTHSVENSCFKNMNFIVNCGDQLFPQVCLGSSVKGDSCIFTSVYRYLLKQALKISVHSPTSKK